MRVNWNLAPSTLILTSWKTSPAGSTSRQGIIEADGTDSAISHSGSRLVQAGLASTEVSSRLLPRIEMKVNVTRTAIPSAASTSPTRRLVQRWMPTGLIAHVQLNDSNRRGPGEGRDAFAPVLAALQRTGYDGWIAMEPFEYIPDGPTCAARSIGYVSGILETLA